MKKNLKNLTTNNIYMPVSRNICWTGTSYRVRVCGKSFSTISKREAYAKRRELLEKYASS